MNSLISNRSCSPPMAWWFQWNEESAFTFDKHEWKLGPHFFVFFSASHQSNTHIEARLKAKLPCMGGWSLEARSSTEMGEIKKTHEYIFSFVPKWLEYEWLLRPHFLSCRAFHPTNPHMEARPKNGIEFKTEASNFPSF